MIPLGWEEVEGYTGWFIKLGDKMQQSVLFGQRLFGWCCCSAAAVPVRMGRKLGLAESRSWHFWALG